MPALPSWREGGSSPPDDKGEKQIAKKNDTTTPAAEKAQTVSLNSDVRITFVERENSPERLVCEAELVFGAGLLAGMKLVGFSLWKSPEGE